MSLFKTWRSSFEDVGEENAENMQATRRDIWKCSVCGEENIVFPEDYGKISLCDNCFSKHKVFKPEEVI